MKSRVRDLMTPQPFERDFTKVKAQYDEAQAEAAAEDLAEAILRGETLMQRLPWGRTAYGIVLDAVSELKRDGCSEFMLAVALGRIEAIEKKLATPKPTVRRFAGFVTARAAGQCADGAERDGGKLVHLIPDMGPEGWAVAAACGMRPGRRSAGWQGVPGREGTCRRCRSRAGLGPRA
mgnify:CR=1 FL=1